MKTAQSYFSQQLQEYFTPEAWSQFEAYLSSLQTQLVQQHITEPQIQLTFSGIEDYVIGFSNELSSDSKITFRQAIDLIEDLGTPSEIISDLETSTDYKQTKDDATAFCIECGSQLQKDLVYCNHCGRNTAIPSRQFGVLQQRVIDRPYDSAFVIVFGIAIIFGIIGFIIAMIALANGISITVDITFGFTIVTILLFSLISLIVGWMIDEVYGEYKSFKQRYEILVSYFSSNRFIGHFLVVVAIFTYLLAGIFFRDIIIDNQEGNPSATFIVMALPLYLLTILSTEDHPGSQEVSYYQLLSIKSQLSRKVVSILLTFNKKLLMPLVIISGIWHFAVFQQFITVTAYAAIPGWFMFLLLLLICNSFYYAHIHTWKFLHHWLND